MLTIIGTNFGPGCDPILGANAATTYAYVSPTSMTFNLAATIAAASATAVEVFCGEAVSATVPQKAFTPGKKEKGVILVGVGN